MALLFPTHCPHSMCFSGFLGIITDPVFSTTPLVFVFTGPLSRPKTYILTDCKYCSSLFMLCAVNCTGGTIITGVTCRLCVCPCQHSLMRSVAAVCRPHAFARHNTTSSRSATASHDGTYGWTTSSLTEGVAYCFCIVANACKSLKTR